jgi:sarcosine oxidase subunit delta
MKQLTCPLNGLRNIDEFVYGGPVKALPEIGAATERWADYVFMEDNLGGRIFEWWLHVPSSFWFVAERDTTSDEVIRTMTAQDYRRIADARQ